MEVFGHQYLKVIINPLHVIDGLIEKAIGSRSGIFEKDGKYYKSEETYRNWTEDTLISKELYEYVRALQTVRKFLVEQEKQKDEY